MALHKDSKASLPREKRGQDQTRSITQFDNLFYSSFSRFVVVTSFVFKERGNVFVYLLERFQNQSLCYNCMTHERLVGMDKTMKEILFFIQVACEAQSAPFHLNENHILALSSCTS